MRYPTRLPPIAARVLAAPVLGLFVGLVLGPWLPAAAAQSENQSDDPARSTQHVLGQMAAREFSRIGHMDLRLQDSPTPEDLMLLDGVLAIAQDLDPTDEELVRHRVDLAYRLGDPDRLDARTRELIRLDPGDTVAQLRLISAGISRIQTAEKRMEAYSRYLGPAGERLDPSIRSRLALDAALLAREQGDERAFVGLLTRAVQLDATNKDAAALAASFFSARIPDDAEGQLELSINLLLADPVDPHVHHSIARQLASGGAFAQADRFHALASRIQVAENGELSPAFGTERLVLAWQRQGPEAPLRQLTDSLANQRYAAAAQLRQYEAQGLPTVGLARPEDIRLGENSERVRVLSAHAAGDQEELAQALGDLRRSLEHLHEIIRDPSKLPAGASIEQVRQQAAGLTMTVFLLHAWTGHNAEAMIERLRGERAIFGDDAAPMLRAFAAIYTDGPEEAERRFREIAEQNSWAFVGLGIALERQGRVEEAAGAFAEIARGFPLQPEGAWARSRAAQLVSADPLRTPQTEAMARLAAGVPVWIDRMIADPSSAMQLEVGFVKSRFGPLEPMELEVRLRNVAPRPLGLGGDRPIQSRMLIAPSIDVGVQHKILASLPEVLELERRLRLNPREQVVATIDAVPAFTGWFLDTSLQSTGRVRARVVQGFRQGGDRRLTRGPLSVSAQTESVLRSTVDESSMSPEDLALWISRASEEQLPYALLAARMMLVGATGETAEGPNRRIVAAITDRYRELSTEARAVAILILPTARLTPIIQPFEDAVRAATTGETNRLVLGATLLTRTIDPADPILELDAVTSDDALADIAEGIRARAESGAIGYAQAGPAIADLMPRTMQSGG